MAMLLLTFLHINILCEKILYSNYYSWEFFYCCKLLISQPSGPNGWGVERRILYEAKYEELSINSALHQSGQGVRLKRFMPSISLGILKRCFSFELLIRSDTMKPRYIWIQIWWHQSPDFLFNLK